MDFNSFKNSMFFYAFVVLTGALFAFLFARLVKNHKNSTKNQD